MSTTLLRTHTDCLIAGRPVGIREGSVVLDETTTYATATFSAGLVDLDDLAAFDPRDNVRASLNVTAFGETRTFDLGLRARTVDHADKTILFECASDEALLDDWAPLADDANPSLLASSIRAVANYVLNKVLPGAVLLPGVGDVAVTEVESLIWKAGVSAWDFLLNLTAAAGLRLFCDETRAWRLVPTSYLIAGTVTALASTSKSGTDVIDRSGDAWVTGVVVRYRWDDSDGVSHERIDAAGEPGRIDILDFDKPYPGPGAASARLNRLRGQGRQQSAVTFARITTTPAMTGWFIMPGAPTQIGRLQRVEFGLTDGFMSLGARELTEAPDSAWIFLAAGETWLDSPVGESWTEEVV